MIRLIRRAIGWLVLLGLLAVTVGGYCAPDKVNDVYGDTLQGLQAQVETLGDWLCVIYADRGVTPPAGPNGSFICPYPP